MGTGVEGVVLAAGLSRRSGRYKMTLPLGDRTAIERTIEGMLPHVARVVVVLGWQAERLRDLLAGRERIALVVNARYREGMFSSVRAGVAALRGPSFFMLPGDQPLIGQDVYARLLATPGAIVVPTCGGRRGHPVLFRDGPGIAHRAAILAQPVDATLRDYVAAQGSVPVEVGDEGILMDLDTPADYAALRAGWRARDGMGAV